jgi:hypothetical protein
MPACLANAKALEEQIRREFEKADADASGLLDHSEVGAFLSSTPAGAGLTSLALRRFVDLSLAEFDVSNDGKLDFDEFILLYNQAIDFNRCTAQLAVCVAALVDQVALVEQAAALVSSKAEPDPKGNRWRAVSTTSKIKLKTAAFGEVRLSQQSPKEEDASDQVTCDERSCDEGTACRIIACVAEAQVLLAEVAIRTRSGIEVER